MISYRRSPSTVPFLLFLTACSGTGAESASQITLRDSAGTAIVEHPAMVIDASPIYEVGQATTTIGGADVDPDHDATNLARAWLVDDALIALNFRESKFTKFGFDGAILGSFGRQGEGPDEFRALSVVPTGGDSIVLMEMARSTWQVLRPDMTSSPAVSFGEPAQFFINPFGLLPDGSLVAVSYQRSGSGEMSGPARREPMPVLRLSIGGTKWDTLFTVSDELQYPARGNEGGEDFPTVQSVTFGASPLRARWGDGFALVDNASWTIDLHGGDGTLLRSIRLQYPLREVTAAMKDSAIARDVRGIDAWQAPEAVKAIQREQSTNQIFADSVAPWDRILLGRDGSLWLRRNETPVDVDTWWFAFGTNGQLERRLKLPTGTLLLAVDGNRVITRRRDADDIGYLEVRQLTQPPN